MSRERKPKTKQRKVVEAEGDKGFQDKLLGMLEWLADKDPVRAAKLIGQYLDELTDELGPKRPKPAKG